MKHDPREVREALKELLALDGSSAYGNARSTIRAAIELITTMQGDLRRQGFIEYQDKEESTE
jgi:hypothetical protein